MNKKATGPLKRKKVLIAEDDPLLAKLLTNLLLVRGYEVKIAPDGALALLEFMRFEPDMVLIDFVMPGFDGLVVAEQFRKTRANVPVVMMTGRCNPELKHRAKSIGISHFLPKPFDLNDIVRITSLCSIGALT
jgi:DNA-binding response OmpR family regulator